MFEAAGGFDETYRRPAAEDIELGYRLTEAGRTIALRKTLQVKHLKRWTLATTVRTDLFVRSLSWSRLLVGTRGRLIDDLNIDRRSRVAVTLTMLTTVGLPAVGFGVAWCAAAVAWVGVTGEVLRFFARVRGPWFAVRAAPALWLYRLCAGLGYLLAWAEWAAKRTTRRDTDNG